MRIASFGEIAEFCRIDGWQKERSTAHDIWTKTLPTGELLWTMTSHSASKAMSPGRFKRILRDQLKVTEAAFWATHASGEPVDRPALVEPASPTELPLYLIAVLAGELHMSPGEIARLELDEAERLVHAHWRRPGF